MRRLVAASLAAAVLSGLAAAQAPDLSRMDIVLKSVPDGPVAKVGAHVISREEFVRFYENELRRVMLDNKTNEVPDGARAQLALRCVGLMIEGRLLYDEALRRKVTVPAEDVEKEWLAKLAQTQKIILAREKKQLPEADVLSRLGYARREDVLDDIKRALITEKMRETVVRESGVTISDDEVHKEFEIAKSNFDQPASIHLQQIYINPKNIPGGLAEKDERARKKAQQALDRLAAGQSFEGVSRAVSDAPDAKTGGDMGLHPLEDLPPFMIQAAAKLKPGEVSGVLQSEFGFHVIKLLGAEGPRDASEAQAAPEIRQSLLARRGAEAVHAFCDKLVKKGNEVRVYLELEKNLALNGVTAKAGQ
jgi:peptidyl-prolyl cis-trans isomerase SurA